MQDFCHEPFRGLHGARAACESPAERSLRLGDAWRSYQRSKIETLGRAWPKVRACKT